MSELPPGTRIGLLFGNERTGLSSRELRHSNFRFAIPQAFPQPSYNLASAVLLTLFPLFSRALSEGPVRAQAGPLPRSEQEACIHRIIQKLEAKRFIHARNQRHIQERIHDLFGRMTMTAEDRDLLLAVFDKGPDGRPGDEIQ